MAPLFFLLVIGGFVAWSVWSTQQKREAEAERQRQSAEQHRKWEKQQRQFAAAQAERERLAAEQRHASQLAKWPKGGTELDNRIAKIDGFIPQVAAQNEKIESDVRQLQNLLQDGLQHPKEVEPPTALYLAGDPNGVAEYFASTLTDIRMDSPQTKVAYLPQSRQLVVEYVLPAVDVVPKAKAYRYVNSQNKIVETARPASQVKGLYGSTIAQLTLLCLAHIF